MDIQLDVSRYLGRPSKPVACELSPLAASRACSGNFEGSERILVFLMSSRSEDKTPLKEKEKIKLML